MASAPAQVLTFLRDLGARAKPFAQRDIAELRLFARERLGLSELAAWDIPYASEKLREERFSFSDLQVRAYFPEDCVLAGMFRVVETIFGIAMRASRAPTWHPGVRFFDIVDREGAVIGQFYLDLYARAHKHGGAWMDTAINRRRVGVTLQRPVGYLTCNFSAPVDGKPALFTHDEVTSLFHEFGHGLNLLLTRVDVAGVSGLEGVEWDAIELPSQFMENFCWEWDVLRHMTSHVDSGEPLPRALFDKMLAAKISKAACRPSASSSSRFSTCICTMTSTHGPGPRSSSRGRSNAKSGVVPRPAEDRSIPHGFSHVFAGGYAAGYYSYKWAEVLSADAYSLFEEVGVLSPVAGTRFRDEVLSRGGSRAAMDSFIAFRGRAPQIDALLRHNGMLTS